MRCGCTCLTVLVAMLVPRGTMVAILILTDWFRQAYDSVVWPLLGFFFMPYTTLAYLLAQVKGHGLAGWWMAAFIVAIVMDVGSWGGGSQAARARRAGP